MNDTTAMKKIVLLALLPYRIVIWVLLHIIKPILYGTLFALIGAYIGSKGGVLNVYGIIKTKDILQAMLRLSQEDFGLRKRLESK